MYKDTIAIAIKHGNKPLPEFNNKFLIPDNTSFSIFLKNMNQKTAYINVFINEKKVTLNKIKLKNKESIDIHRFEDTNHTFHFIKKTLELQKQRKNQLEDGLIRIEVDFEKTLSDKVSKINKDFEKRAEEMNKDYFQKIKPHPLIPEPCYPQEPILEGPLPHREGQFFDDLIPSGGFKDITCDCIQTFGSTISNSDLDRIETNNGVIVPGKITNIENKIIDKDNIENIHNGESYKYEIYESKTIILELEIDNNIELNITKTKKICPSCNKKYKHKYLYCPYDGTFLK
jgi:hypothetical protein